MNASPLWNGEPLKSSALTSQTGTPRPQGGRVAVGHGPGGGGDLSPPLLPTSWASWVPSPTVTYKLSSRPKTVGTGWAQGPVRGAGTDGVRRVWVLWTFATTPRPPPSPCSLQRHLRAALRPAVHLACPASVRHTGQARGQGQHGVPWTRSPPPSSPVPAGNRPFDLRPLDFILSAL